MARSVHACPNCAAPLGIPPRHDHFFRCDHCGSVIEDRNRNRDASDLDLGIAATPPPTVTIPTYSARTGRAAGRTVLLLTVVVLLAGAAGVASLFTTTTSVVDIFAGSGEGERMTGDPLVAEAGALQLSVVRDARLVGSDDDTTPDVVVTALSPDADDALLLYLDEEAAEGLRWAVPSPDMTLGTHVVDDRLVIVSSGDLVVAYDRALGSEVWRATLADAVTHHICERCARIVGDALVTLSTDGTVTSLSLQDGSVRWTRQLAAEPRQLVEVAGAVGVLEEAVVGDDVGLLLLDPADGATAGVVPISCADTTFGGRDAIGIYDPLHELGDGALLYATQFGAEGCVSRWDPGATGPTWETTAVFGFAADVAPSSTLRVGDLLVHAERDVVLTIDVTSGAVTEVARSDEHAFHPLSVRDDVLVVAAESSRGSGGWELWAFDLVDDARLWTFTLDARDPLDIDNPGHRADDNWLAVQTDAGLTVGTVRQDADSGWSTSTLTLQTLPIRSGTASSPVLATLPEQLIPSGFTIGARTDRLYLAFEDGVFTVDVTTGRVDRLA